jgi:hypothetical protein
MPEATAIEQVVSNLPANSKVPADAIIIDNKQVGTVEW